MNHGLIPSTANAALPARYEAAKVALAEANKIDECKDWADKAQALASYAKQADDKEMEKTAQRIRARAVRRCGELLKEIEKANGKRTDIKPSGGTPTRSEAATNAGLSKDQATNAIRVANVPADQFEEQIESEHPPTVTALAEQGTKKRDMRPVYEQQGMTKKEFQAGMYCRGALRRMVDATFEFDPQVVVNGSTPEERSEIKSNIKIIDTFLDQLMAKL